MSMNGLAYLLPSRIPMIVSHVMRFYCCMVNAHCFTVPNKASRQTKFPSLLGWANSESHAWLCLKLREDNRVLFTAYLPSLIQCYPHNWLAQTPSYRAGRAVPGRDDPSIAFSSHYRGRTGSCTSNHLLAERTSGPL